MKILIIGTGYVGLVSGTCFAEIGHDVICLDIDPKKIALLNQGEVPFFEPGLKELIANNVKAKRLSFTTDYAAVLEASVCFIAVPTPSDDTGACDLSYVMQAATSIAEKIDSYKLIVLKSTVPVGTSRKVKEKITSSLQARGLNIPIDVASNPEFLKEGSAINDCLEPDRIIFGTERVEAAKILHEIYAPYAIKNVPLLSMDLNSSEMSKYAANAMLALRISFMNELAMLCEKLHANIHKIREGIGSDRRIGPHFLQAGIGYGGSCFPKDVRALIAMGQEVDYSMPILQAVESINERQKKILHQKMRHHFESHGGIRGKTIALWGLAFKPDTDDMRDAPSLTLIQALLNEGARLRLFDPIAQANARSILGEHDQITWCSDVYDAADNAHAVALLTEWKEFKEVNLSRVAKNLNQRAFFDGRNQYSHAEMQSEGFTYFGVGVPH